MGSFRHFLWSIRRPRGWLATGGGWTEKVLHDFSDNGTDGLSPYAGLIADAAGNLYGTTDGSAAYTHGTIFKLSPLAGGGWSEVVLHNFGGPSSEGWYPNGPLVFDSKGNLYGSSFGGAYDQGMVFEFVH